MFGGGLKASKEVLSLIIGSLADFLPEVGELIISYSKLIQSCAVSLQLEELKCNSS